MRNDDWGGGGGGRHCKARVVFPKKDFPATSNNAETPNDARKLGRPQNYSMQDHFDSLCDSVRTIILVTRLIHYPIIQCVTVLEQLF